MNWKTFAACLVGVVVGVAIVLLRQKAHFENVTMPYILTGKEPAQPAGAPPIVT